MNRNPANYSIKIFIENLNNLAVKIIKKNILLYIKIISGASIVYLFVPSKS
jgi:hypothetical protein